MAIIKDNTQALLRAVEQKIGHALDEAGNIVEQEAKDLVHVRTGATQESITHEVSDKTARIGATTDYAAHLEGNYPYLRPALHKSLPRIVKAFRKRGI